MNSIARSPPAARKMLGVLLPPAHFSAPGRICQHSEAPCVCEIAQKPVFPRQSRDVKLIFALLESPQVVLDRLPLFITTELPPRPSAMIANNVFRCGLVVSANSIRMHRARILLLGCSSSTAFNSATHRTSSVEFASVVVADQTRFFADARSARLARVIRFIHFILRDADITAGRCRPWGFRYVEI